jgi:hypothetical protein
MTGLTGLLASSLLLVVAGGVSAAGSSAMVEPIFARYARIYLAPTVDFRVEYFRDKPIEELDDFDGYSLFLDFTYPINEMSQIELQAPFYT